MILILYYVILYYIILYYAMPLLFEPLIMTNRTVKSQNRSIPIPKVHQKKRKKLEECRHFYLQIQNAWFRKPLKTRKSTALSHPAKKLQLQPTPQLCPSALGGTRV
jgi:hypothetical protein